VETRSTAISGMAAASSMGQVVATGGTSDATIPVLGVGATSAVGQVVAVGNEIPASLPSSSSGAGLLVLVQPRDAVAHVLGIAAFTDVGAALAHGSASVTVGGIAVTSAVEAVIPDAWDEQADEEELLAMLVAMAS
jgi:hypothetical protein